jgi:predicted dehydrogenase
MRFLVVGLGSMGKRRIRNLQALGYSEIAGFDPREDRRVESASRYGIKTFNNFVGALSEFKPNTLIISTDPSLHMDYAEQAIKFGLHCFIEASVVEGPRIAQLARMVANGGVVIVPSCTMHYFPGPIEVRRIIKAGKIGKPLNINYLTGQYLPDWHPWEHIREFYVSRRETGGAREIVPFELTWLNEIFGEPKPLSCLKTKLTDMDVDIDDIYCFLLRYPEGVLANITIEVISRPKPVRELHITGSRGRLVFSGDENCVRYITTDDVEWTRKYLGNGTIESGYVNPEEPYILEMSDFINSVKAGNRMLFPNTLESDASILSLLTNLEGLG